MKKKKIKVGFDLDGVIIGKPFFVPQFLMELLVRSKKDHELLYRYPKTKFERWIRVVSHHPILRPPIRENIRLIEELSKSKKYKLYVVSSRYNFLAGRTKEWFGFYKLGKYFKYIYINTKNEQPHFFKERMINKLQLNTFIDDDRPLLNYLKKKISNTDMVYVTEHRKHFKKK
jgi:hypothetical protein